MQVGGAIAYAGQQAFIVNATLQDNVTFGQDLDEERWKMCVDVSGSVWGVCESGGGGVYIGVVRSVLMPPPNLNF